MIFKALPILYYTIANIWQIWHLYGAFFWHFISRRKLRCKNWRKKYWKGKNVDWLYFFTAVSMVVLSAHMYERGNFPDRIIFLMLSCFVLDEWKQLRFVSNLFSTFTIACLCKPINYRPQFEALPSFGTKMTAKIELNKITWET